MRRRLARSIGPLLACASEVGNNLPGATGGAGSSGALTTGGGAPTTTQDAVTTGVGSTATTGATTTTGEPPAGTPTDPELLVGDQGSGADTRAVYQLIVDEGADMLIVLGDFDDQDDPDAWAAEMEDVLGDSFPVFAVVGNHGACAAARVHNTRPQSIEERTSIASGSCRRHHSRCQRRCLEAPFELSVRVGQCGPMSWGQSCILERIRRPCRMICAQVAAIDAPAHRCRIRRDPPRIDVQRSNPRG